MTTKTKADLTAEFATALGCQSKFILARLKFLELAEGCSRCCGAGYFPFAVYNGKCFKCHGQGCVLPKLTQGLLTKVQEAVAAGKLQPYLDGLVLKSKANKLSSQLLEDYGNLTAKETALVAAAGLAKKSWTIGTEEGFLIRAASHPFYDAAHKATLNLKYAKTDADKLKFSKQIEALHAAMLESPKLLPAGIDCDTVRDIFKRSEQEQEAHNAISKKIDIAARAIVKQILETN